MFNTLGNFVEISMDSIKEKKNKNEIIHISTTQCSARQCDAMKHDFKCSLE